MELMHPSKVQLIYDETIWTITQYTGQPIEKTTKHDFVKENGGKWVELERIYHLACVANEIIRFHNRLVENDLKQLTKELFCVVCVVLGSTLLNISLYGLDFSHFLCYNRTIR